MIKSIYLPQLWDMELHKLNSTYYILSTVLSSPAEIEFLLPHEPILNDFSHFFPWTLPYRDLFIIKSSRMWCFVAEWVVLRDSQDCNALEMSGITCPMTHHHISEYLDSQQHCCENLKSCILYTLFCSPCRISHLNYIRWSISIMILFVL